MSQINCKIHRSGVIDQQKINPHDLCYKCSKDGPEFLFGKLRIRDYRDEPCFPSKVKILSCKIQMNTVFNDKDEINRSKCDRNIHKVMIIPVKIYHTNKKVVCFSSTKNACRL